MAHVKLRRSWADSPYLQEYYGTVEWAVRAIYSDHLGWFDGNPTRLCPIAEKDRGQRIVALAGGVSRILSSARDALESKEFRWAAELTDFVLRVDAANIDAMRLKAQALTESSERQTSASARNYYLSAAQHLLRSVAPR